MIYAAVVFFLLAALNAWAGHEMYIEDQTRLALLLAVNTLLFGFVAVAFFSVRL